MEPSQIPTSRPKLHPLVATAAIAVIALSAVGIGAFVMNRSNATPSPEPTPSAAQTPPAATAAAAPAPASAPAPLVASGPSTPVYNEPPPVAQVQAQGCRDCGVVDSFRDVEVKGEGTGVGGVGGAVVGGLLGNMVGAGRGKALATVAGAVGGGFAGNAIEKNVRTKVEHQMIVRLDDGRTRTFTQVNPFPYGIGDRVRIVNGHVERG